MELMRNLAGEELLQFCTINQLTVMNTWFEKKDIYFGTWRHPGTKKDHTIDLVMMRAGQRVCCKDVQVMRGANCWTDHKMVRVKLRIQLPLTHGVRSNKKSVPFAVHHLSTKAKRDEYMSTLENKLQINAHSSETSMEDNWTTLKSSITAAAEESIGRGRRKQPEWFEESTEVLVPLVKAKNDAYATYLRENNQARKTEFRRHQRAVKRVVDKAKEEWVCRVATQREAATKDGQTRWKCIRRLQ